MINPAGRLGGRGTRGVWVDHAMRIGQRRVLEIESIAQERYGAGLADPAHGTAAALSGFGDDQAPRPKDAQGLEGAKWMSSPRNDKGADQAALWAALDTGGLQIVSSDHAPYRYDASGKLQCAPFQQFRQDRVRKPARQGDGEKGFTNARQAVCLNQGAAT